MDTPFIGTILIWPMSWAPYQWALCNGQQLQVNQNQALYSLLGTTFGGTPNQNFNLPDFRGRVPVGYSPTAVSPVSANTIGQKSGVETITLTTSQVPLVAHTHQATVTAGTGPSSATATLFGINGQGGEADPQGNFLGQDNSAGAAIYAKPSSGTPVAMATGAVTVSNVSAALPSVAISSTGGQPAASAVSVMQPGLVVNYIIALQGVYPTRQ